MKFLRYIFLCIPFALSSQGILNNGAYIVTSGAAQIYVSGTAGAGNYLSQANGLITPSAGAIITIEGNWTNNAGNTGFTADAGTVVMNGAAQSINGSASTTFYNLTLQGSGTKTLNVNTTVGGVSTTTGVLSIGSQPLDLNSRTLTISNTSTAAVTYTTGYAISETNSATNPSIITWNTGAFAGTYVYPFGSTGGTQIPLTFNKTVATASNISIATRPTATSANTPWATGVTQMYDPTLVQDGSDEAVIDRWWEITATVAVTADITFRYLGTENTLWAPYNTGNLGAQYWSTAWLPNNSNIGSAAAVLAGVGAVTAPALAITTTYTPWILSSLSAPLPVELTSYTASCNGSGAIVEWTTASETNNDFFTLYRSDNGIYFQPIGTVNGSGTTSSSHTYSFNDATPVTHTVYYKLKQTDFNGVENDLGTRAVAPCTDAQSVNAWSAETDLELTMENVGEGSFEILVTDARGRLVRSSMVTTSEGFNSFHIDRTGIADGVYFITVRGGTLCEVRKVLVQR